MSFLLSRLEAELKVHEERSDRWLKKMEETEDEEEILSLLELSEKESRRAVECSKLILVLSGKQFTLNEKEGEFDA